METVFFFKFPGKGFLLKYMEKHEFFPWKIFHGIPWGYFTRGCSTFLATRNATIAVLLQNGVLDMNFFLQLAMQQMLRCKLQEKLLRVTWPLICWSWESHFRTFQSWKMP